MRSKFLAVATTLAAAAMITGCAIGPTSYGPASTGPAFIYTDNMVYPAANTSGTTYELTTDDFEIKGTVMASGESTNLLGIIASGDNGYQTLLEEARAQGCDDVMNVRMDVRHTQIVGPIYQKTETTLMGQGVKWK